MGIKIKKFICESGLKIGAVAKMCNISFNTFSAMLNGKRKISADEYFLICSVLKVPLDKFI